MPFVGDGKLTLPMHSLTTLKEGEVSPYKIVIAVLIREVFSAPIISLCRPNEVAPSAENITEENSVAEIPSVELGFQDECKHEEDDLGEGERKARALLLLYQLLKTYDMTYAELLKLLSCEKANALLNPQLLERFQSATSKLLERDANFLYELANSILESGTPHYLLQKKLTRNSPFGKYLRTVCLNIRKMSYPQALHLHKNLVNYVGLSSSSKGFKPSTLLSSGSHGKGSEEKKNKSSATKKKKNSGKKKSLSRKSGGLSIPGTSINGGSGDAGDGSRCEDMKKMTGLDIFQKMMECQDKECKVTTGLRMELFSKYLINMKKVEGTYSPDLEKQLEEYLISKETRVRRAEQSIKSLRELWDPVVTDKTYINLSDNPIITPKPVTTKRFSPRKFSGKASLKAKFQQFHSRKPQSLIMVEEGDEDFYLKEPMDISMEEDSDFEVKMDTPKKSVVRYNCCDFNDRVDYCQESCLLRDDWDSIRWWNRSQIEKVLRKLCRDFYCKGMTPYTPKQVSCFIQAISLNPSATTLLPQLHFIEYLNSLRLKDVCRAADSLRTSFDVRVKTVTPFEIVKSNGYHYAPFNFAMFYSLLEFRDDRNLLLNEAFRAGHLANNSTCLLYCDHLWADFQDKPFPPFSRSTTGSLGDGRQAYLQILNMIGNTYSVREERMSQDIIYTLFENYPAEDTTEFFQEIEGMLLNALSSFFSFYGWHQLVLLPAQIILFTPIKWPIRAICTALCYLAQGLLSLGHPSLSDCLLKYGSERFIDNGSVMTDFFLLQKNIIVCQRSYFACGPVEQDAVQTIFYYDRAEALYWVAYDKFLKGYWTESCDAMNQSLDLLKEASTMQSADLQIRCLLLKAEIYCFSRNLSGALKNLEKAIAISKKVQSDYFVSFLSCCIAAVKAELGFYQTANDIMQKNVERMLKCWSPWLSSRLMVINIKLHSKQVSYITPERCNYFLGELDTITAYLEIWGNVYRMKEILHLKIEILEKTRPLGSFDKIAELKEKFLSLKPFLRWSPETCII